MWQDTHCARQNRKCFTSEDKDLLGIDWNFTNVNELSMEDLEGVNSQKSHQSLQPVGVLITGMDVSCVPMPV